MKASPEPPFSFISLCDLLLGVMSKHLLTPDRAPTADQGDNSTQAQLGEVMSLLNLVTEEWVKVTFRGVGDPTAFPPTTPLTLEWMTSSP